MSHIGRSLTTGFGMVWMLALAVFVAGYLHLFGLAPGSFAELLLAPIGLPWNRMLDVGSEQIRIVAIIFAPAINMLILAIVCRLFFGR